VFIKKPLLEASQHFMLHVTFNYETTFQGNPFEVLLKPLKIKIVAATSGFSAYDSAIDTLPTGPEAKRRSKTYFLITLSQKFN
jgi:hypothetical protein